MAENTTTDPNDLRDPVLNANAGHQADLAQWEQSPEGKAWLADANKKAKEDAKAEADAQEEVKPAETPKFVEADASADTKKTTTKKAASSKK